MTSRPWVRIAAAAAAAVVLVALGVVLVGRASGIAGSGTPAAGLLPESTTGRSSAPAPGSSSAPDSSSAPGPSSPPGPPSAPAPGPSSTAAPARRFLADLAPRSGAASVQPGRAHSLRITCAGGSRTATVEYGFPAAAGVRSLATGVGVTGAPGTQVRIEISVDGSQVVAAGGTPGSTGRLSWSGDPAASLRLRVTCDPGATAAVLTDPQITT